MISYHMILNRIWYRTAKRIFWNRRTRYHMIRIARCCSWHNNAVVRSALSSVRYVAREAARPRSPKLILRERDCCYQSLDIITIYLGLLERRFSGAPRYHEIFGLFRNIASSAAERYRRRLGLDAHNFWDRCTIVIWIVWKTSTYIYREVAPV